MKRILIIICGLIIFFFCSATECDKKKHKTSSGTSAGTQTSIVNHHPQITKLYYRISKQETNDTLEEGSYDNKLPRIFHMLAIWDLQLGIDYVDADGDACEITCKFSGGADPAKGAMQACGPEPYQMIYRPPTSNPGDDVIIEIQINDGKYGFDGMFITIILDEP